MLCIQKTDSPGNGAGGIREFTSNGVEYASSPSSSLPVLPKERHAKNTLVKIICRGTCKFFKKMCVILNYRIFSPTTHSHLAHKNKPNVTVEAR